MRHPFLSPLAIVRGAAVTIVAAIAAIVVAPGSRALTSKAAPMLSEAVPTGPARCCALIELRQYTLHPGARDTLVRVFEQHFIEGQEAFGMKIVGQFRDDGDPDRFVWVRGFDDMESRRVAIDGFYTGPVWKANNAAARATMVDTDNVLLLKPVREDTTFPFDPAARPPLSTPAQPAAPGPPEPGEPQSSSQRESRRQSDGPSDRLSDRRSDRPSADGLFVATVYSFDGQVDPGFASWFRAEVIPALTAAGTNVLAQFVTETAPNTSRRLPVREGKHVFVWFTRYPDRAAHDAATQTLAALPQWRDRIGPALRSKLETDPERLVLTPTPRSFLR